MARFCPDCGTERSEAICPIHSCPTLVQGVEDAPEELIGQTIGGRYKLGPIIGRGGFGTVFRASHVTTHEDLVVKVLKSEYAKDPLQVQRFLNEGRAAVKLKSQHSVRVTDFAQTETGQLYIAMELLHGQEMAKVLRDEGFIDPLRAVHIGVAVLKSLAEAHHLGLVHRDLKPENIFLCEVYGEPELVKLIDFGIAKSFASDDQDLTKTGFAVGTPKYMSPEQARAEPLDGRSDLYSLGVILYQALAGEVPFRGASAMATVVMHLNSPPPPLEEKAAGPLPDGLATVVMKVLSKDRNERYVDAEDMRAALETVLEHAGVAVAQQGRAKTAQARGLGPSQPDAETAVLPSHVQDAPRRVEPAPTPKEPTHELNATIPLRHMNSAALEETPWNPPASTGQMAAAAAHAVAAGRPAPELVPKPLPQVALKTVRPKRSTRIGPFTLFTLMTLCGALVWWVGTRKDNESVRDRIIELARVPQMLAARWNGLTLPDASSAAAPAPAGDEGSAPQARPDAPRRKGKAGRVARTGDVAIDSAIAATQGSVRKCFARLGSPDRDSTRVTVDVSIGSDGQVGNVTLRGSGGNSELQTCVEKAVQTAQLPASAAADDPVTWTYDVPLAATDDPAP